jgi:hypothetical protein
MVGTVDVVSLEYGKAHDFLRPTYGCVQEPLKLTAAARQWFANVHDREASSGRTGLVLGATPWLAGLLTRTLQHVVVADSSDEMLQLLAHELTNDAGCSGARGAVRPVRTNWLQLPTCFDSLDVVAGDNSFSFLEYPSQWRDLCDLLAARMPSGALLLVRMCSVPTHHQRLSIRQLVEKFCSPAPVNYTEIRTAVLFAHWNRHSYAIDTEEALASFEQHRTEFNCALAGAPSSVDNDLVTMAKYRGTGAIYYAPPLDEIVRLLGERFHVESVQYGPYRMSDYFPLVVARRP